MTYKNSYGEEFTVNHSEFNIFTTDNKKFDRVINSFDLNLSINYPHNNEDKNKSCFLEIETENESILVTFKTSVEPSFDEMYEPYYNYETNSYDVSYTFDLINNKNQLVLMYGTSIIILDIDTFKVLNFSSSNNINNYGINLYYKNNIYIVEDILHKFSCYDDNLNILSENEDAIKVFKDKVDN